MPDAPTTGPRVEVNVRRCVYCNGLRQMDDDEGMRCANELCRGRDFRAGTATLTGRDALVYALGAAADRVHQADVQGEEFPSEKAAAAWMQAREDYEAALSALRALDANHEGDR